MPAEITTQRPRQLTLRQKQFAEQYVKLNGNAQAAAIAAGYSTKGAGVQGHRLLNDAKVRDYIDHIWRRSHMTADEVVGRLAAMARTDATELVDDQGKVDIAKVKKAGIAVRSIKHNAQGLLQVEVHDQKDALVHVGKALGVFKESVSLESPGGGPLVVTLAMDPGAITGTGKPKEPTPDEQQP